MVPVNGPRQMRTVGSGSDFPLGILYFFANPQSQLVTRSRNGLLMAPVHTVDAWLLNGVPIPNSASRTWAATQPGTYTYRVRTAQGQTLTSQPQAITITDLRGSAEVPFSYSNPASNTVTFKGLQAGAAVMLYDAAGRLVFSQKMLNTEGQMDVSHLPQGVYALALAGKTHKLLIAR